MTPPKNGACPACGGDTSVIRSRGRADPDVICFRRRRCLSCGISFSTIELVDENLVTQLRIASARRKADAEIVQTLKKMLADARGEEDLA